MGSDVDLASLTFTWKVAGSSLAEFAQATRTYNAMLQEAPPRLAWYARFRNRLVYRASQHVGQKRRGLNGWKA